jgi:type II secretory pathway component PulF
MPLIITPKQLNQRAELYHQLGIMLTAGLSVLNALEHLQSNPPSLALRAPISKLRANLNEGDTLAESIRRIGNWIPSFDIALIDASERSGRLDVCFKLLADYYRERAQLARQMISDMAYPVFVFHFAILIFSFVNLIKTGNLARCIGSIFIILAPLYAAVFFIVYACQGRHNEIWRSKIEGFLGCIPLLRTARQDLALARLATALESLLTAGVPIVPAWELAATATGSPALGRVVRSWKGPLQEGSTPSELVSKSDRFPDLFSNLYHTGEISGTLDQTLIRLHNLYQSEGLSKMKNMSSWTAKLIHLGILLIVAWMIVSWYVHGPMADLNNVLNGK